MLEVRMLLFPLVFLWCFATLSESFVMNSAPPSHVMESSLSLCKLVEQSRSQFLVPHPGRL